MDERPYSLILMASHLERIFENMSTMQSASAMCCWLLSETTGWKLGQMAAVGWMIQGISFGSRLKRRWWCAIPVIPVLVGRRSMPSADELPSTLVELAYRNAVQVDIGRDFHSHMDRLIRGLDEQQIRADAAECEKYIASVCRKTEKAHYFRDFCTKSAMKIVRRTSIKEKNAENCREMAGLSSRRNDHANGLSRRASGLFADRQRCFESAVPRRAHPHLAGLAAPLRPAQAAR